MSPAYKSALDLSFDVRAGLVMRQIHHWAALLFLGRDRRAPRAGLLHRRVPPAPRDQLDDRRDPADPRHRQRVRRLLAARRPAVGHRPAHRLLDRCCRSRSSGTWIAFLLFGGEFPGADIINRLYVIHILIVPGADRGPARRAPRASLVRQKHTQFPGAGRTRATTSSASGVADLRRQGARPVLLHRRGAVPCSAGSRRSTRSGCTARSTRPRSSAASQPDWYMGWLDGALRLMPGWEIRAFGFEIPNPFFPGRAPRRAHVRPAVRVAVPRSAVHRGPRASTTCSTVRATARCGPRSASP